MISVIVPIYNTEGFLPKCIASVLSQSYKDLEILLIDDGSTDQCGEICDRYAALDSRIRVFHTENHGLSAARNLGLDQARGEYIGFVDSDDWIEPDMYECLLEMAAQTKADVVECGVFQEYSDGILERKLERKEMLGMEAVNSLLNEDISNTVWNKLWKRECFERIRFPENRVFEEYATTYRIYAVSDLVCSINSCKYHYIQRRGSLSRNHDMKNLVGYWLSNKERYEFLKDQMDEISRFALMKYCARGAARTWAYYLDCTEEDRNAYRETVQEINTFVCNTIPLFGDAKWSLRLRISTFFPHFISYFSFRTAWLLNRLYRKHNDNNLR